MDVKSVTIDPIKIIFFVILALMLVNGDVDWNIAILFLLSNTSVEYTFRK